MTQPTFDESRRRAYRLLGEAADELRHGDWPGRLAGEQAYEVYKALRLIGEAKDALNRAAPMLPAFDVGDFNDADDAFAGLATISDERGRCPICNADVPLLLPGRVLMRHTKPAPFERGTCPGGNRPPTEA